MITLNSINKSFGSQTLLANTSLQINIDDRYALVGPNGSGKTTLFKMLLGKEEVDSGNIFIKRGAKVGYLPQENAPITDETVLNTALSDHEAPDGSTIAQAKTILMGLGFKISDFDRPVSNLSGGWAMRVAIAKLLTQEPDLLLLDEPTNHLDLESLLWFQQYLQDYAGAIFVISHDRQFINTVCEVIVSVQEHDLKMYYGNYENYVATRESEREKLEQAYYQQQQEIVKMKEFIDRNRARLSTATRAQNMIKRLDKLELLELPSESRTAKISFPQPRRTGNKVLDLKNIYKSYGDIKVYEGLDFKLERGKRMVFVGHNGAGKSTLLKMLAGVEPIDSGGREVGSNVNVGYYSQHRSGQLDPDKTVFEIAMSNERAHSEMMIKTVLGTFLFPGDAVYKKVSVLSGGELSRLALVHFLLDPPNVLLMDEPTTHLDMHSVEMMVKALKKYEGTLCFISHDLYLINSLANQVIHVDNGKVTIYPGSYSYFERRQEQIRVETQGSKKSARAPRIGKHGSVPKQAQDQANADKKEERRRRAEERGKVRAFEQLKKDVDIASKRLEELATQLSDPALYSDYAKVQAIGDEMEAMQAEIAAKESELQRHKG
ncbi:ABC-F family ATP-binding cassette domain-containing protein [Elusimicrobiota bacterium]